MRSILVCLCGLALWPCGVVAQSDDGRQPTFRSGVDIVEVSAVVSDQEGHPLAGLEAEDFEVFEDGQRRPLISVRRVTTGSRRAPAPSPAGHGVPLETVMSNV